jgi:signal transduction histidine kinase
MTPPRHQGGAAAERGRDRARGGPARYVRRLPLFWKILLSNATVVALGVLAGGLTVMGLGRTDVGSVTGVVVAAGIGVLLVSVAVNAVLIRLALSPVEDLHEAAEEVLAGRLDARSAISPYADRDLRHLVSAFNNMLDSLALHRHRQQELARRVLEAEERERGRIAHELFSRTAQTLAGVLVRLRVAERHVSNGGSEALREIREGTVDALEEIRGVARRLRPPELDELGVGAALEAHARSMTEGTGAEVAFEGTLPSLPRETSLALFRILQEAINNAVLHGRPDRIRISFRTHGDRLVAEVEDDGTGFDLENSLGRTSDSLGLFGMHERAGYVHGELAVESVPGRGTVVRVTIPVRPVEADRAASLNGAVERLVEGLVDGPSAAAGASRPTHEPVTV